MNRSWLRYLLPALLLISGVTLCVRSREQVPSSPSPSPATEAVHTEYALLGNLRKGEEIDGWTVEKATVRKNEEGKPILAVDLARKGSGLTVWVERREQTKSAPIVTKKYAVSHGYAKPFGEPIPPEAFGNLAERIATRVRTNEEAAPIPDGL